MSYSVYEKLCKLNNVRNSDVAKATGISQQTLSSWKNGGYVPKADKRRKIADYFGVSLELLDSETLHTEDDIALKSAVKKYVENDSNSEKHIAFTDDNSHDMQKLESLMQSQEFRTWCLNSKALVDAYEALDKRGKEAVSHLIELEVMRVQREYEAKHPTRLLSYYGKIAAAGTFIDSYAMLMEGTVAVDDNAMSRCADYAIGVSGDSMEPEYYDGDVVLVSKSRYIDYGDIGIFQYNNDVYIKKLSRDCLESLNPNYAPIPNNGDIRCLGKVLGKAELI